MIESSRVGNVELVKLLLEQKGIILDGCNKMGWTALFEACRNQHAAVVKLLTDQGSSVTIRDTVGDHLA